MTAFHPVLCSDGARRAFLRVEFAVTREDIASTLSLWRARHGGAVAEEMTADSVRQIVRNSFYTRGMAGDNDDATEPTDADREWAERQTNKVWPSANKDR